MLNIDNSAYIICCTHEKSDVMPSSFVFLFFAFCHHASVPAALFQKPQLLFLPSRLFPHVLQRLCVQDFCKKQALTLSIFPAVPFVSQRITRCPIVRKKCGGECKRDSSSDFSWEISERRVALESGSQCMRILPKSLLETVFEKRVTLNWIEPLLAP